MNGEFNESNFKDICKAIIQNINPLNKDEDKLWIIQSQIERWLDYCRFNRDLYHYNLLVTYKIKDVIVDITLQYKIHPWDGYIQLQYDCSYSTKEELFNVLLQTFETSLINNMNNENKYIGLVTGILQTLNYDQK